MSQVLNRKYNLLDESVILIDRSTPWGNPFIIGVNGNRDEVCNIYESWLERWIKYKEESNILIGIRIFNNKWVMAHVKELRGKDLVCWCSPSRCHGNILIELANK